MATIVKRSKQAWLYASLTAAALVLGGCADKDSATSADDPNADIQTPIEQEATGVDNANAPNSPNDPASSSANNDVAIATDDVGVATADDAEVLEGTESEEHISTY